MPLNHVALTVLDRERSAEFYGEHFGLTQRLHADDHLLIIGDAEGSLLALSNGHAPGFLPRTNHFGFQVRDADEVRAARQRFHEADLLELEWQDDDSVVRVQVADPDGYRVEIYSFG